MYEFIKLSTCSGVKPLNTRKDRRIVFTRRDLLLPRVFLLRSMVRGDAYSSLSCLAIISVVISALLLVFQSPESGRLILKGAGALERAVCHTSEVHDSDRKNNRCSSKDKGMCFNRKSEAKFLVCCFTYASTMSSGFSSQTARLCVKREIRYSCQRPDDKHAGTVTCVLSGMMQRLAIAQYAMLTMC